MESIGRYLKNEREIRQVSLEELAQTTRIPLRHLWNLEDDHLERLPGDVFVRGFLKSYAKAVGLVPADVLRRFEGQSRPSIEPSAAPLSGMVGPDRSRRFGLAIALVIIVILFTLALSIALRPRHREAPAQLSMGRAAAAPYLG
jgi:cytoskeletal protein RodZ